LGAAGRPVPSMSVKSLKTRTSAWIEQEKTIDRKRTAAFLLAPAGVPAVLFDLFMQSPQFR